MCSSSLQRKKSRLYRCKRKKENQRTVKEIRAKQICRVPSKSPMWVRIFIRTKLHHWIIFFPFLLSVSLARVFPSFFLFSPWRRRISISRFARYHSLSPFTPSIAISHTACPLDFLLYISSFLFLSSFHSLTFFLSHFHSRSHSFALIEYNSYVITGGRHPMSISSGMRDERFSPYHLDDFN